MVVVVGYSLYQSRFLLLGPTLIITKPIDGEVLAQKIVEVRGSVSNATFIYLDDRQIFADEKGVFREILLGSPGYNIMTIRVKDSFGREREEKREFILKLPTASSTATTTLHS